MRQDPFGAIVRRVARRPLPVLAVVAALALAAAALALRLEPSAATGQLVERGSDSFAATERYGREFGGEAVLVLVEGDLRRTLLTADLGRLLRLEGCLAGNVPPQALRRQIAGNRRDPAAGLPPVCAALARLKPFKVVLGPATFVNAAAGQIADEFLRRRAANERQAERAAAAARRLAARRGDPPAEQSRLARTARAAVTTQFTRELLALALRYGLGGLPSIDDPDFVSTLVFDRRTGRVGQPKGKFAYLFPSARSALVQARLRQGLDERDRRRAIALVRAAVRSPAVRPREGGRYVVTGVPVLLEDLADELERSLLVLLGAALLLMAATLALAFRTRLRLLPLALALAAAALTFGALALGGGSLTVASIAVLPVLVGLAVDYAIQFQARFDERRARRPGEDRAAAAAAAASAGGPTIATAALATGAGFLALLLSPLPIVRGFGALLVLGVGLAIACALTAGFAALVRFGGPAPGDVPAPPPPTPGDLPAPLPPTQGDLPTPLPPAALPPAHVGPLAAGRRAGAPRAPLAGAPRFAALRAALAGSPRLAAMREAAAGRAWRALDPSLSHPRRVLAVGVVVAVAGLAVDTRTEVASDVRELVPGDLPALRDLDLLQAETGVAGELDVTVRADDVTRPEVVSWMTRLQGRVLREHGLAPGRRCAGGRGGPELCPALSLPDLFGTAAATPARAGVRELLDALPPYLSQGVVSSDRRSANLAFGIRLLPLERQRDVVEEIRRELDPPPGVEAEVVGLPLLAAEANAALASPWRRGLFLVAALAAVFLVLLAARRSGRAAAVPLVPIALASGWSAGLLFLLGLLPRPLEVDANPMSAMLGALVIAISTEFSVLLSARYAQERAAGAGPTRAIELAYASTGAAVLASGATAVAGFAALAASDIRMLRDFGIATVVNLGVSLVGVLLVLPAALLWAEQHGPFSLRELDPRRLARGLRRPARGDGSRAAARADAP